MRRKATLSILAAILLIGCITSLKVSGNYDDWVLGSWTVKNMDGESVVCAPDSNYHSHIITKEVSDKNQIRLTAKVASSTATIDGNFGVLFKCTDGTLYFFEYNIVYDILRVRRWEPTPATIILQALFPSPFLWDNGSTIRLLSAIRILSGT